MPLPVYLFFNLLVKLVLLYKHLALSFVIREMKQKETQKYKYACLYLCIQ